MQKRKNVVDSIIEYFSPETALKREYARSRMDVVRDIQNSGYGNHGASTRKKSMKGWNDAGGSAIEDIHDNMYRLRVRSRDLFMGVPLANGALKTYRTNVIGSGLVPKPTIDSEAVRLTEERTTEIEKQITREWNLWADSVNCDAERMATFYELQQLAFVNWIMSGDVFALLPMKQRAGTPYELCIQLIEADRVCTPNDFGALGLEADTKIVGGVECDESGEVVAYHIANCHPLSTRQIQRSWKRVEAFGKLTGRRNVLHVMSRERIGQRRGVPMLAPVIEALKQIGRYTDAELTAAVVNGYFSVFIESQEHSMDAPLGEVTEDEEGNLTHEKQDEGSISLGPGSIIDLAPGEKANAVAPGRPNANFEGFVSAIAKQIGAALELPYEMLMKQFTASYSASRAALLEAWKSFGMYRDWAVEKFCQPIYEEFLREAVAKGRIKAPGFFRDEIIQKAYCSAQWYGPTQGQLDPVKEVTAAQMRIQNGFSTRSKEAAELTGTDFADNMRTAKLEVEMMKEVMGDESQNRRNDGE